MDDKWLIAAVADNAAWCDAIAASHGVSTFRNDSVWYSRHPMPRYYPNIITLSANARIDDQIAALDGQLPVGWGVKDSFKRLSLQGRGFALALEGQWYCRPPGSGLSGSSSVSSSRINSVSTETHLSRWVDAWGQGSGVFSARLLRDPAATLLYVEHQDRIIAGLAVHELEETVGISNAFGHWEAVLDCVRWVITGHPGKAVVGYGDREEVDALSGLGFQTVGGLQIWVRT